MADEPVTESRQGVGRRALLLGAAAAGVQLVSATAGHAAPPVAGRSVAAVRSVGGYDVLALTDAVGTFFLPAQTTFAGASTADWDRARRVDPAAFGPDDAWRLSFRCFAVRRPGGRIMLVDLGVGPAESPAAAWAPVPGRLPLALAEADIDPDDVDLVVLTHLHEDHAGWTVGPDGQPVFRNARYVVQAAEVAALEAGGGEMVDYAVRPLRAAGQLHVVDGRMILAGHGAGRGTPIGGGAASRRGDQITVVPTPGHTPGHQSVLVEGARRRMLITGDVLVHAVQLVNPAVAYRYEADQSTARQTREVLLRTAAADRAVLATAHLNEPFVAADACHR